MTPHDIARLRLVSQSIAKAAFRTPAEVVTHLGAVQAQDYPGALWSVGLRMASGTQADVEAAIAARSIVRTWPMRGTLHFVPAEDARWMLELLTPRIISSAASRHRQLELTDEVFDRSRALIVDALSDGAILTRDGLFAVLERHGISTAGQRGVHIYGRLAQEALICHGPHQDKQPTFVLFDAWIPVSRRPSKDEAVAELARRYFTGHGPATMQDFVRWTGLKVSDAKTGLKDVEAGLEQVTVEGQVYWMAPEVAASALAATKSGKSGTPGGGAGVQLLPGFDEYMLGYGDRSAALDPQHAQKVVPGSNGMFMATLVIDGRVEGTWRRAVKKRQVEVTLAPFRPLTPTERDGAAAAVEHYGRFLGLPAVLK